MNKNSVNIRIKTGHIEEVKTQITSGSGSQVSGTNMQSETRDSI